MLPMASKGLPGCNHHLLYAEIEICVGSAHVLRA